MKNILISNLKQRLKDKHTSFIFGPGTKEIQFNKYKLNIIPSKFLYSYTKDFILESENLSFLRYTNISNYNEKEILHASIHHGAVFIGLEEMLNNYDFMIKFKKIIYDCNNCVWKPLFPSYLLLHSYNNQFYNMKNLHIIKYTNKEELDKILKI